MKIISARITAMPKSLFDPMPQVYVTLEDGTEQFLYEYYPDEISFSPSEFVGLTIDEAKHLKFIKDRNYLQS
jgi:hypothetical protein